MASQTPNMHLVTWDQLTDFFSHTDLLNNWSKVDGHDHIPVTSGGNGGAPIPSGGIQNGAITNPKLATNSVGTTNIVNGSVTAAKLASDYESAFSTYKALGISRVISLVQYTFSVPAILHTDSDLDVPTAIGAFYIDPADWSSPGRTTKVRLRAQLYTGSTAAAMTFTAGLYPVTAVTAAAPLVTLGTVVASSTVQFVSPSASSRNQAVSSDFVAPAAGHYALAVTGSAPMAVNSKAIFRADLQMRQV